MLYGIDTADRDKTGYLSAKTRYRPWSGQPMEGRMEVVFGGRSITLQRKPLGNYPMRDFSAVYTGTSEPVPQLKDKTAGETLTGVTEPIFERSAFIRQSGLAVDQTAELEKRITSLVSTGEESVSYSDVDKLLREWLRKRKYNQRGLLPAAEAEARQVREKLEAIESINERLAELHKEKEHMEKYRDEFLRESEKLERYERKRAREAYLNAEAELKAAQRTLDETLGELGRHGKVPGREEIAEIRGDLERLTACDAVHSAATARCEQIKESLNTLKETKKIYKFNGMSAAECEEKANRAAAEYLEVGEEKAVKVFDTKVLIALLLSVLFSAAGFIAPAGPAIFIVSLAIALAGAGMMVSNGIKLKKMAEKALKRAKILEEFGVSSVSELMALVREYKEICYKEDAALAAYNSANEEASRAERELEEVKSALLSKIKAIDPTVEDVSRAPAVVARTEKLLDALEIAQAKRDSAKKLAETLAEGLDLDAILNEAEGGEAEDEEPRYNRAEIAASLKYAEKQLMAINSGISMAQGELKSLGDPVVLRTRAAELDERIKELSVQYDAIALAIDTLSEANTEIQSRFAPLLSQRASEILAELTGGRYEKVTFNKKLAAETERAGDSASRSMLYLSGGATDQLYLALRLAVCELVLPKEDPCPIILDDALASFDDTRMKLALDYLKKVGEERQVIVFTCHSREAAYFSGVRDVNIVKLKKSE